MKHIFEYLFSKKSDLNKLKTNSFGITKKDMIGEIKGFPVGVVVKMMEEQKSQGNKPNIKVFQWRCDAGDVVSGFDWGATKDGNGFWYDVIMNMNFDRFFKAYPEYKKYDI